MSNNILQIDTIGPVKQLSIPLPEGGGCVVLRGPNGAGKSTALDVARRLAGSKQGGLAPTDGARRGSASLGSAKLSVTPKKVAQAGELEVETIEGRFDVSELIDPQIKDPDRADAARLRALVSLSGAVADESLYEAMIADPQLWERLKVNISTTDDPVALCGIVKRAIEARARQYEDQASELSGKLKAMAEELDEFADDVVDSAELIKAIDNATRKIERLEGQREFAERAMRELNEAAAALAEAEAARAERGVEAIGNDITTANLAIANESNHCETLRAEIADLKYVLEQKERKLQLHEAAQYIEEQRLGALQNELHQAQDADHAIAQLETIVNRGCPVSVDDAEIEAAEAEKAKALEAYTRNEDAKKQQAKRDRLAEVDAEYARTAHEAERLRTLAAKTESVLVGQIGSGPIRYKDGRLVVETDRSDSELFAELSHGERAKIAIDIAAEHVPEDGLIVIRQEVFESLQPANQRAIHEHAKARGVVILTAAVADGDGIRVESVEG